MAVRRDVEPVVDVDLDTPPPNWQARWVWALRWGREHMGGAESRSQNWRTVYNAQALEPALERVRAGWADKAEHVRRRVWEADAAPLPGWADALEPCEHGTPPGYCTQECRDVRRLQRAFDDDHRHHWQTLPVTNPKKEHPCPAS